jgi:hypothetical protein
MTPNPSRYGREENQRLIDALMLALLVLIVLMFASIATSSLPGFAVSSVSAIAVATKLILL